MQTHYQESANLAMSGFYSRDTSPGENGLCLVHNRKNISPDAESAMVSEQSSAWPVDGAQTVPLNRGGRLALLQRNHAAQNALRKIQEQSRANEVQQRHLEEMQWIRENRSRFVGLWVALIGSELLASGSTAKEVFEKASCESRQAPLVIRLDEETLPFAGW